MIKTNTVFILGAAASMDYGSNGGFPLGAKLVDEICDIGRNPNHSGHVVLREMGYSAEELMAFRNKLFNSQRESIDAFLADNEKLQELGKLHIAAALIQQNEVTFITFNYDRSLEQFLLTALTNAVSRPPQECLEEVKKINVIHMYGQLGDLPGFGDDPQSCRPYATEISQKTVKAAAKGINTIYDKADMAKTKQRIEKALTDAKRVCFLGFGYDVDNMTQLCLEAGAKFKHVYGTAYKATEREIAEIKGRINHHHTVIEDKDIDDFLRSHELLT